MRAYELKEAKYPLADFDTWYGNRQYKEQGGKMVYMTPDEYLSKVRALELDDISMDNVDDLVNHIQTSRSLDPLVIYPDGKEDGRHRAYAAKKLGIDSVPVIIWEGDKTLKLPDMNVGDEVKVGRFKNRKAIVKGFKKDDHGQPVLKTTKGDQKLFKPRISKLEPNKELDETFDRPYDYSWDSQSNGAWRGHFIIKANDEVDVSIEHWQKYWKIEFSRNKQHGVTGGGDAVRIFTTVIAMIDEFIDIQSPDVIKFSADKSKDDKMSRAKLYSTMIQRFAAANGYNSQESIQDGKTSYLLTRKEDKNASI